MYFNNNFNSMAYLPQHGYLQQNTMPNYYNQQSTQTNIVFVNGIEGAKGYVAQPNSNMLLFDSEDSSFYIKTTNNIGVSSITKYKFVEDTNDNKSGTSADDKVSKLDKDYKEMSERLSRIESLILKGGIDNGKSNTESNGVWRTDATE